MTCSLNHDLSMSCCAFLPDCHAASQPETPYLGCLGASLAGCSAASKLVACLLPCTACVQASSAIGVLGKNGESEGLKSVSAEGWRL